MLKLLCVVLSVSLSAAPAFAVYNASTVTQVEPPNPQDQITITATFTGPSEAAVKRSVVLPWNYTDEALAEWSVSTLEKLNGLKAIGARIKATDSLPTVRPAPKAEAVITP